MLYKIKDGSRRAHQFIAPGVVLDLERLITSVSIRNALR